MLLETLMTLSHTAVTRVNLVIAGALKHFLLRSVDAATAILPCSLRPPGSFSAVVSTFLFLRQRKWPKTFSFGANYLHLDELFQHGAPVTYENNDGDPVKLAAGKDWSARGKQQGFHTQQHVISTNSKPSIWTIDVCFCLFCQVSVWIGSCGPCVCVAALEVSRM